MAEVVLQLEPAVVRSLQQSGAPTPEFDEVTARAATFGAELQPVHPRESDPALARHFRAEVPDLETAERLAEALRDSPGVEGAYVKPEAELP